MTLTRAKFPLVILSLLFYIGYLHLEWWDTRILSRQQSGVRALLEGAAQDACLTRSAIVAEAGAQGWPHRTGEFAEYDPATDNFPEHRQSGDALYVMIDKGVPFSGERETVFLFDQDDCLILR